MRGIIQRLCWILLFAAVLQAEHISWQGSYDQAHQKALKENKLLMVLLIDENCPLCHKMLCTTFMDQPYIKKINEKFVSALVRKGQKESYPIEMLYTLEYPSVFFLNGEELFVGENIYGYADAEMFGELLDTNAMLD